MKLNGIIEWNSLTMHEWNSIIFQGNTQWSSIKRNWVAIKIELFSITFQRNTQWSSM